MMETRRRGHSWRIWLIAGGIGVLLLVAGLTVYPFVVTRQQRRPPGPPIRQALADAVGISIQGPPEDGMVSSFVFLTPEYGESERWSAAMFRAVKGTTRFGLGPPRSKPDLVFSVHYRIRSHQWFPRTRAPIANYLYVSTTGELGRGNDWCIVPDDFRQWLRERYLKVPKRHFRRTWYPGGVEVITPVLPRTPPLSAVEAQGGRSHIFKVLDANPPHRDLHSPLVTGEADAYEAQYTVGSDPTKKRMVMRSRAPSQQWPVSYVGKTITYRFRWLYKDGTTGPWSKPVTAKVLP